MGKREQLNLLILSLVPVRADRLGCYGYSRDTSPAIDAFARDSVLYEGAYATSAWTPPSHASTMTGLYPWHHGVVADSPLSANIPTMAEYLASCGYHTGALVNTHHMGAYKRLDVGFKDFRQIGTGGNRARRSWLSRELERRGFTPKNKGTSETTAQVLEWLKSNTKNKQPFFLLAHYHEAHHPYAAPAGFRGRFSRNSSRVRRGSAIWRANLDPHAFFTQRIQLSGEDLLLLSDLYDEEIAYLDREHILPVLETLKRLNYLENTVVVITSPHGESLGEHGLLSHVGGLYENLLRVPLIIRSPGMAGGMRQSGLAQVTDILPTVLDLLQIPHTLRLDGVSLPPFSPQADERRFVAAEWSGGGFGKLDLAEAASMYRKRPELLARLTEKQLALRVGDLKYIEWEGGRQELYNLLTDPGENLDLSIQDRSSVERLSAQLRSLVTTAPQRVKADSAMPSSLAEDLRAQGYKI